MAIPTQLAKNIKVRQNTPAIPPRFSIYLAKRRRRSTKDKLFLKEGVVPIWWVMLFLLL